jgi:hypothetical protein
MLVNRASILLRNIEARPIHNEQQNSITGWRFFPFWDNSGSTLARNVESNTNFTKVDTSVISSADPSDLTFDYPDYNPLDVSNAQISIGPRSFIYGRPVEIDVTAMEEVKLARSYAFLWGWIEYDDVFLRRHRTEFCYRFHLVGDLSSEKCEFGYRAFGPFNGYDGDCMRQPTRYEQPKFYKFLHTKDIDYVLIDKTIKVSSFDRFRKLESSEWGTIADRLEAQTELTVKDRIVAREGSPELEMLNSANLGLGAFTKFVDIRSGGRIEVASGTAFYHQVPNMFIYSMSFGKLRPLTEELCVKARKPYDACLEIISVVELKKAVLQHGWIRVLNRKVADVFSLSVVREIEYENRSRDIKDGPVIEPSPFKKDPSHKAQSEVRMLLVPKEGELVNYNELIIELRNPARLFKEQFRDFRSSPT